MDLDRMLSMRVAEQDAALITLAAAVQGVTVSDLLRRAALDLAREELHLTTAPEEEKVPA